ncbi:MAG: fumarylacetoacetate hydrolase family protein [Burkholderiales bacterium]|nr:fumarylacetoacetate hydrolase family protein [Burkholderiales bacterium]
MPPAPDDPILRATLALLEARRLGTAVPAPGLPDASAAYAVQRAVLAALGDPADAGARHWKTGGSGPATHAPLPSAGVLRATAATPADATALPLRLRLVEAELALRLGRDVDAAEAAAATPDSARAWVDAVCVSIELVESRWLEGLHAPAPDTLADLQSHGALVLGDWVPFAPRDWSRQRCTVNIDARETVERTGTHPLGDPVRGLPEWARHACADGSVLRAGTVVTTGSWVGMLEAAEGERVDVVFDGIGRAAVRL